MLEARQDIVVRSPVDGIIESVPFERDSYIKRGPLIASLASGPQRAALDLECSRAGMQGELKAAEVRTELARSKFLTFPVARFWCALAFGAALLIGHTAPASAATAQVATEVPAGKSKTVRLRRLPEGAIVAVRIKSSGPLQVALVSALQLKTSDPRALFRGALDRTLTFQVVVPASSDYYLMLDNRRGSKPVQVETTIAAKKGSATPPRSPADKPQPRPGGKLEQTSAALVPHA